MVAKNEITGDKLQSKLNNQQYEDNFDRIFGKKKDNVAQVNTTTNKPLERPNTESEPPWMGYEPGIDDCWDEKRVDVIGSNGNDGLHYIESEHENTSS